MSSQTRSNVIATCTGGTFSGFCSRTGGGTRFPRQPQSNQRPLRHLRQNRVTPAAFPQRDAILFGSVPTVPARHAGGIRLAPLLRKKRSSSPPERRLHRGGNADTESILHSGRRRPDRNRKSGETVAGEYDRPDGDDFTGFQSGPRSRGTSGTQKNGPPFSGKSRIF